MGNVLNSYGGYLRHFEGRSEVRNALWLEAYQDKYSILYKNTFLHDPQSPYHDPNNIKLQSQLDEMNNLLKESTKEVKLDDFLRKITLQFSDYKEKTKQLIIALILAVVPSKDKQMSEIQKMNNIKDMNALVFKLNEYYLLFRNKGKANLIYNEEGYASAENNLKDEKTKKILENAFDKWINKLFKNNVDMKKGGDGFKDFSSALQVIAGKKKTLDAVAETLDGYISNIIQNKEIQSNPKIAEALTEWFEEKKMIILNQLSQMKIKGKALDTSSQREDVIKALKTTKTIKTKDNKEEIVAAYARGSHFKRETWLSDFNKVKRKAGIYFSVEDLGFACEDDLVTIFNGRKLIFDNKKGIRFSAERKGEKKINGRTQTTDVEIKTPSFVLENGKLSMKKTASGKNVVNSFNISYKNSIPDPNSSKYETGLRSMSGINNALDYFAQALKNLHFEEEGLFFSELDKLLSNDNRSKLSYFFVNEYFTVPNQDFDTALTTFLSTIGEFYQFAIAQKDNERFDQIDFMMINQKIVPSGYLWSRILEKLKKQLSYKTVIKPQKTKTKVIDGKKTKVAVWDRVGDNFGSFYENPYSDTKGKNLVSDINIKIKMAADFRNAIRDVLKDLDNLSNKK